jgi:hypothetical protein
VEEEGEEVDIEVDDDDDDDDDDNAVCRALISEVNIDIKGIAIVTIRRRATKTESDFTV